MFNGFNEKLKQSYNLCIRLQCTQWSNRECRPSVWSAAAESFNEICKVKERLHAVLSGDSKEGPGWAMVPQIFAWPPFVPPSFLLNLKIVWLTNAGLPNAFCKNTGHFVNSARDLSCVVIRKRHTENRETISIVKRQ